MSEHEHMPKIRRYTARYLSPGKISVKIRDNWSIVLTWDEAHDLAETILDAMALERP